MNLNKEHLWYIAGLGAMGTLFATHWCRGGEAVHLLLKDDEQLARYQQSQLTINSEQFNFNCHPPATAIKSEDGMPIDYLLCCTKAYDIVPLLRSLKARISPNTIIILIHNGVGVLDELREQLPQLRIISGITTLGAYAEQAYTINGFLGGSLYLGETRGRFSVSEVQLITHAFKKAALTCQWLDNIYPLIWEKFAINCSINLLTALFSCKNGSLLKHEDLLKQVLAEVVAVFNADNIQCSLDDLSLKVTATLQNTAGNYSSMCQDIRKQRRTELHYLNAYLVRRAQQLSIDTPVNSSLLNDFFTRFPEQRS